MAEPPNYQNLLNLPDLPFSAPPIPAINPELIHRNCQHPLIVSLKRSDVTQRLTIQSRTFDSSHLYTFFRRNIPQPPNLDTPVNVYGLLTGAVRHRMMFRAGVMNIGEYAIHDDERNVNNWPEFAAANNLREGDRVALYTFTFVNAPQQLCIAVIRFQQFVRKAQTKYITHVQRPRHYRRKAAAVFNPYRRRAAVQCRYR